MVNDLEFPDLHGDLLWTASQFAVTHADARFLDGQTRFSYVLAPLGTNAQLLSGPRLGGAEAADRTMDDLDLVFGRGATRFGRAIRPAGAAFRPMRI